MNECRGTKLKNTLGKAVEKLFDERKEFIILGLTGRTGSGCTTIANLINKEFKELFLSKPDNIKIQSNEDRRYRIIYNYCKENWNQFEIIEMRNIITSFILEEDFNSFIKHVGKMQEIINLEIIIESLNKNEFKNKYEKMNIERNRIKHKIEENQENLKDEDVYKFYFEDLSKFTKEFKKYLENTDKELYTKIYQEVANNIRSSGTAFDDAFNYENIYKLSQRTNTLIKILRKRNKVKKDKGEDGRVLVVIDAFRNPYEVTFFKDRYSAFYLLSINTNNKNRKERLYANGFKDDEIFKIDEVEYNKENNGSKIFSHQNIRKCIELADIYIDNSQQTEDYSELKKKLVKYITLIMHPGIITPTHIERSMQIAYDAKMNSGCISRQVGAVVTDNKYSIKSIGWNTVAEGQTPCNLRDLGALIHSEDMDSFSSYEKENIEFRNKCRKKLSLFESKDVNGRLYPYCFKDVYNKDLEKGNNQVYTRSLHAEENAFLQISKFGGQGLQGGYLFTTASPCELCAKKAYQIGIKNIYYIDPYPGISEQHILNCGDNRPNMILFEGVIGRAFTQLYVQIIPYKDEIQLFLDENE